MSSDTGVILQGQNITKTFSRRRGLFARYQSTALAGVDLELRTGEILGLVGESGSGKSTLSKILLGLLPPSSGVAQLHGKPLQAFSQLERARCIQMIFQDPYSSLNPARTVGSMLEQPLLVHGVTESNERRKRVAEALELVRLPLQCLTSRPADLSGGQRQRVVIARALILRPEVVICDEPTSALDVSIQAQILNLLLELRRELGLSYLFVSHNLAIVAHMANRVAVMQRGKIVEMNDVDTIFSRPQHPYTRQLMDSALLAGVGHGASLSALHRSGTA